MLSGVNQDLLDIRQPAEGMRNHGGFDELRACSHDAGDLHLTVPALCFGCSGFMGVLNIARMCRPANWIAKGLRRSAPILQPHGPLVFPSSTSTAPKPAPAAPGARQQRRVSGAERAVAATQGRSRLAARFREEWGWLGGERRRRCGGMESVASNGSGVVRRGRKSAAQDCVSDL
jgi:hypothetical protein